MEQKTQSEGDFSEVLGNILSNPEMLSSIKSIAEKLKPSVSASAEPEQAEQQSPPEEKKAPEANMPDAISALAPLLSADFSKFSRGDDRRACLLRALKPYLSEGRCEAIEYIIKFSAISEILKNFS